MARRKQPFMCNWCKDIPRIERGGRVVVAHFNAPDDVYEGKAALDWLARRCRCNIVPIEEVPEIRRSGSRILKAGANVYVQLKRKPGTTRDEGVVLAVYENGTVKIQLLKAKDAVITVPADEYVTGRAGTMKLETDS